MMQRIGFLFLVTSAWASLAATPMLVAAPAGAETIVGRSVTLAGRKVHCGNAEIMVDRDLPSEGGAGDDFLVLNPDMLNQQPKTVRLFVFTHECGHLTVGDSELKADCWAVNRGVREHWLDRKGLNQVCQSFEGAPETPTHPSARRRCGNLDRCFATALAALPAPAPEAPDIPVRKSALKAPRTALSAWRCTKPLKVRTDATDPIAHLITQDAKASARCR